MNRRWEWIILSVRSLTDFEENIVMTVLTKLVLLVFKCSYAFFLARSLIDRCQIVTDTCKNNVSKFVKKPFKSPLSLRKWKCFGVASLFNLHHLYFNYHFLAQKTVQFMEDLAVFTAPNQSGSFGKNFVKFQKKKKCYLPAKGRSVWWKTMTSVWKMLASAYGLRQYFSRPRSQFFTIRTSHPANNIYFLTEQD